MKKLEVNDPETKSDDIVADNIEQLRHLFPEAFTEGKIDFETLKQLLGGAIDESAEKYGLNWHGKRRARKLALTPSTGTLRPCPEESVDWDTTQNLFIEGDNLEVLKLLQKSYGGKVKLIYIDPPYNTGGDFVYPDDFRDGIGNYLELTGQVQGGARIASNPEQGGRHHTNWLNMMYPRLVLAKALLHVNGAICVSLDDTEVANFREMADEIFGGENFLATIIWEKVHTRKNSAKTFSVSHDYVVVYAKNKPSWDRILVPREGDSLYKNPDADPKGPWKSDPILANNPYSADYKITKPNGTILSRPVGSYWRFSEKTWNEKLAADEVLWGNGDSYPLVKRYLSEVQDGLVPITLFSRKYAGDTAAAKREVDALFETQGIFDYPKPTLLIQRLIQICARPNDTVMDFFAGSGTTAHSLLRQNAEDNGHRRFIVVQLPEPLDEKNSEQRNGFDLCSRQGTIATIAELTKERIRRAARKLRDENPLLSGDLGFRVFKLDSTNIREWDPDRNKLEETLEEAMEHIKAGRSEQDILYEVLLKLGLDLCVPIETRTIADRQVHSIGGGVLIACLSESIPTDTVEELAQGIVAWHKELAPAGDTTCVFRDSAFPDDVAKTNLSSILEQHGIATVRSL